MNPYYYWLIISVLSLIDVGATQFEITRLAVKEWNVVGALLIGNGWVYVWIVKVCALVALLVSVKPLTRLLLGRLLLGAAIVVYCVVTICHSVILLT